MIATITLLSILGYLILAGMVGRGIYNITLLESYNKQLRDIKSKSTFIQQCRMDIYNVKTVEDAALHQVYAYTMVKENAVLNGIFWPFSGLWYYAYLLLKKINIQLIPKNSVEKLLDKQEKEKELEANYKKALKVLKEAGVDIGQFDRIK